MVLSQVKYSSLMRRKLKAGDSSEFPQRNLNYDESSVIEFNDLSHGLRSKTVIEGSTILKKNMLRVSGILE